MNLDHVRELMISGQLLSAEKFDDYRTAWREGHRKDDEGEDFVRWLFSLHELTEFQEEAVLAGISGPYLLGPYRVTERIAAGRLGDVFHAEQIEFQQPVSLKIFPASINQDSERLARLGREARVSLQVSSPFVVKTYQIGRIGQIHFIALEELRGEALEQKLEREGAIPFTEACRLMHQAALGLAHLHSLEIIHRDICPANLWITDQNNLKIMEFGAARDAMSFVDSLAENGAEVTINQSSDTVLGTYAYMSAVQAEDPHAANVSTDLYSLGCTLYHCLTGQVPFPDKNPVRQMLRHANEQPRSVRDFDEKIPEAVDNVVTYLLAKRPEDQYETANEAAQALAAVMTEAPLPEDTLPAPDFLRWLETVNGLYGTVFEEPKDPDWNKFVDWVSHRKKMGSLPEAQ